MAKSPPKDYYASVMFPGTKKLSIVSKRLGSKERLHAIATCTNETVADKIVEALNLHQGRVVEIENVAQKIAEQMRGQLADAQRKNRDFDTTCRELNHRLVHVARELASETARANKAEAALAAKEPTPA